MRSLDSPRRLVLLVGIVVGALVTGTWLWLRGDDGGLTSTAKGNEGSEIAGAAAALGTGMAIPVEADTVRRGTLVLEVNATGQTEADRRVAIATQSTGRVAALALRENDLVGPGRLLMRLDPREAALGVERARASLAEAQARYRELTLFDERITDADIRRERAEAARARSGLASAEVGLRESELALARTMIAAPFAGRVADIHVTVGENVAAGQEIMTVVDLDPIRVEVQVVESELRWLREGSGAEVRLSAFPDTVYHGRIATVNPVVDPETRTARATVVVPNPGARILPGMFARVVLDGRAFEDRTLVPKEAILERDGRTLVFLFEPSPRGPAREGRAKWVYVTTGLANDGFVELVEGEGTDVPEPGRLVLIGSHMTLIHDARVRVVSGEEQR